ncbi:MAG: hypothetical protein K2W95_22250 [Candidatus Obscuribacterales bacterium]|nr:hypothetical protein [Candidatus Obscuribacterales bacterium]
MTSCGVRVFDCKPNTYLIPIAAASFPIGMIGGLLLAAKIFVLVAQSRETLLVDLLASAGAALFPLIGIPWMTWWFLTRRSCKRVTLRDRTLEIQLQSQTIIVVSLDSVTHAEERPARKCYDSSKLLNLGQPPKEFKMLSLKTAQGQVNLQELEVRDYADLVTELAQRLPCLITRQYA